MSRVNPDIEDRIKQLVKEYQSPIWIEYNGEFWIVMARWGDAMVTIPGTCSKSLEDSVAMAENRWTHRSVETPFLHTSISESGREV